MTQCVFPMIGGRLERMHKRLDRSLPGAYIFFYGDLPPQMEQV